MTEPALYDLPDLYDRLVPPGPCESFYRALVADSDGPVLELGCGSGRLTVPLAHEGRPVTGLDSSAAMLGAARAKALAAGVEVEWVEGDMRRFDLGRRFGLIVLSCNSLAHMTTDVDLAAALARVRAHLAPRAAFAFDVVNPGREKRASSGRETLKRAHSSGGLKVRERADLDEARGIREARWRVESDDGRVVTLAPLVLRRFAPDELPRRLAEAGLALERRVGDFDRRAFRASASRHQICVARAA